ncbi:MAG: DUF1848 domain-containing protein [Bacilli bacterium]|nr:DUF1848 domain-containing protein [Bacilli bacterium]
MILMVSGRCDIVAFHTEWFMNRYKEGYVDVRNPFNPKLVSRINFNNVDLIMFCTKNPIPIVKYLNEIEKPILFHVTLTSYNKDIEPNVLSKKRIVEAIKEISDIIGIDNIYVRYDPILINDKYTVDYHIKAFDKLCKLLNGYTKHIIISFVDIYKNVKNNSDILNLKEMTSDDYKKIGTSFSKIAKDNNMTVQTCYEDNDLTGYGFIKEDCLSKTLAYKLTGRVFEEQTARKEKKCHCVKMVDIGVYNTCRHLCKYCYANYDEKQVSKNIKKHNPKSSLLIGELEFGDIIKERYE